MYYQSIQQMAKMLTGLSANLDKAKAYADEKKFDVEVLLNARLAPDMFPLKKQIQASCDNAKFAVARLSGQEPPSHPDNEVTFDEFKARIEHTVDYLRSASEDDFAGAADRKVVLNFMPEMHMLGEEYLLQFSLPNFYFHLTCAYAILRHNGVPLSKQDYMVGLPMKPNEKQ